MKLLLIALLCAISYAQTENSSGWECWEDTFGWSTGGEVYAHASDSLENCKTAVDSEMGGVALWLAWNIDGLCMGMFAEPFGRKTHPYISTTLCLRPDHDEGKSTSTTIPSQMKPSFDPTEDCSCGATFNDLDRVNFYRDDKRMALQHRECSGSMCNDISSLEDFHIKSLDSGIIFQAEQWFRSSGTWFYPKVTTGSYTDADHNFCICLTHPVDTTTNNSPSLRPTATIRPSSGPTISIPTTVPTMPRGVHPCNLKTAEDIIFLFGHTKSMTKQDMYHAKIFAMKLLWSHPSFDYRVAAVGIGDKPRLFFGLDEAHSDQNLQAFYMMNNVKYIPEENNIAAALDFIMEKVVDFQSGRTTQLIIFVDEKPTDNLYSLDWKEFRKGKIQTVLFGIGSMEWDPAYRYVVNSKDIYQIATWSDLNNGNAWEIASKYMCIKRLEGDPLSLDISGEFFGEQAMKKDGEPHSLDISEDFVVEYAMKKGLCFQINCIDFFPFL